MKLFRDIRDTATLGWAIVLGRLGFEMRSLIVIRKLTQRLARRAMVEPKRPRILGLKWEL